MMMLSTLAFAALTLAGPQDSQAMTPDERLRQKIAGLMQKLDTDKDGVISRAEAGKMWPKLEPADENGDGGVTAKELYEAWSGDNKALTTNDPISERVDAVFTRCDKNEDGYLTKDEAGRLWARIVGADTDGDGKVNKKEVYTYWKEKVGAS